MEFTGCTRLFQSQAVLALTLALGLVAAGDANALDLTEGDDIHAINESADATQDEVDALGEDDVDLLVITGSGETQTDFLDFEAMTFDGGTWTFSAQPGPEEGDLTDKGALHVGEASILGGSILFDRGESDGIPETGEVNVGLIGNVNISDGALLGGNATIKGDVTNSGTLSPGLSIGTLRVEGQLTLEEGSTLFIEADATPDVPQVADNIIVNSDFNQSLDDAVNSDITINGGELHLDWTGLDVAETNFFALDVLRTDQDLTGVFDSVMVTNLADPELIEDPLSTVVNYVPADGFDGIGFNFESADLLLDGVHNTERPVLFYSGTGLQVLWMRDIGGFTESIDGNTLQVDVGDAVQSLREPGDETLLTVVDRLTLLGGFGQNAFLAGLDGIDGGEHLSLLHSQRLTQERFVNEVAEQMRGPTNGASAFVRAYRSSSTLSDDDFAQGFSGTSTGVIGGLSIQAGRYIQLGGAISYETTDVTFDDDLVEASIDSFQYGGFAHLQDRTGLYGTLMVTFSDHSNDVERGYAVGNQFTTALADYDSDALSAHVDVGKTLKLDKERYLIPHASFTYSESDRDAFSEFGTPAPSVSIDSVSETSMLGFVGLDSWFRMDLWVPLAFELSGGVQYEFGDTVPTADSLINAGTTTSTPYVTQGVEPNELAFKFGASVQGAFTRGLLWKIGYDGQFGDISHHTGILSLHVTDDIF